jgi:hypothetical protein
MIILLGAAATSCAQDRVVEMSRLPSPDGAVFAVYEQHLYGGAAGGIGHCISITASAKEYLPDCMLLASSISGLRLTWNGRILNVHYRAASITEFRNEYFKNINKSGVVRYEIQLLAD